jgi:hypothetical protein
VHNIDVFNFVVVTGQMCDYAIDGENILLCSVLDLFHMSVIFFNVFLPFLN